MSPALYRAVGGVLVPVVQVSGGAPSPGAGYAGRDALDGLEGTYKPSLANTGSIAGVELQEWGTVDQTVTVTSGNLTLRDMILRVDIDWRSSGTLDVRNCVQLGWNKNWTSNSAWIRTDSNPGNRNVFVTDTTIKPAFPSSYANGQIGPDVTFKRVLMEDVTDGFGFRRPSNWNSDVRARALACMVHRMSYFTPDPAGGGRANTHNDCIQLFAGYGIDIIGNTLLGTISDTSGTEPFGVGTGSGKNLLFPGGGRPITVTPTVNVPINVNIFRNWMDYGASGDIAFTLGNDTTGTTGNTSVIKGNRHGRNQPSQTQDGITARRPLKIDNRLVIPGFSEADNAALVDTNNGNIYEDNGSPITYYTGSF